jgi:putative acetyltransferase
MEETGQAQETPQRLRMPLRGLASPRIRRATLEDCPAILRAHRASVTVLCAAHYTAEQIEAWIGHHQAQDYHSAVQNALVLVAETEGELMGFAHVDLISGTIHALYVDPRHVGQGIGRSLLLQIETESRQVGLRRLHLDATLNSVAFCQARGFLPLRASARNVAGGTALPCVEMEKAL